MNEREIFIAASELTEPEARAKFLEDACAGDLAMKLRVEALLRAHDHPDSLLDRPAVDRQEPDKANTPTVGCAGGTPPEYEEALAFLAPPTRADSIGRIGHYEVLQVLGQGGFGIVFRAFDEVLHRVVAVKVLSPQMAATSPARKRFLREARSSAQVRHENVVQVYEVGEQPLPYIAMELIPGETLQQRLDRTGPVDVPEVVRIGRQIAEGLAAAHANDLVHRDIKPGNILLEGGAQRVKITDFGLARAADDASISQSGLVAGTPMFMAPEQARGESLDQRADLFSLGSVLYVMAAGRPPFRANGTLAVLKRVAEDTPRPIREVIPETPQWLCDIISKLHAKEPEDRFQSAREVADVLADCETQLKANAKLNEFPRIPNSKPSAARSVRSVRWKWVAAAIVLLAACVVWLGRASTLSLSNKGELEILPEPGLVSVIVLQNDEGVIDGNKLHAAVTDWLNMKKRQTLTLPPGRYQLNVGTWPAGSAVGQWEVTTSGLFGSSVVLVPVVQTSAIITLERGERVSLRAKMRPAPVSPPDDSKKDAIAPRTDPDRRAAEYVLSAGGAVKINDEEREILVVTDLPREPFRLSSVALMNATDEGLSKLEGCKNLVHLKLSAPAMAVLDGGKVFTDEGLAQFKDCRNLATLHLYSPWCTDEGLLTFKDCKNLTILSLSGTGVTDAGLARIRGFDNLTQLDLSNTAVTDAGLVQFQGNTKLTHLSLSYARVSDAGLSHFSDCKELTDLDVAGTHVDDAGIGVFTDWKKLKNLTLWKTQVGDAGLAQLSDCKELRVLNLAATKVTDAGLAHLMNFKGLTKLELWDTRVSDAGLPLIAGLNKLTELNLLRTKVTRQGVKKLAKLLPNCAITWDGNQSDPNHSADRRAAEYVLSLGGTVKVNDEPEEINAIASLPREPFRLTCALLMGITDSGLANFTGCKDLTCLDLSWSDYLNVAPFTDEGLSYFEDCKNLTSLSLSSSGVTDEGLAHFEDCKNLTSVSLNNTGITDAGLLQLKECKNLTILSLQSVGITDAGLARVRRFNNLTQINLQNTRVTDAGLVQLEGFNKLTHLNLAYTPVTDAGLIHLKDYKKLISLNLRNTVVSDVGMASVAGCTKLAELILGDTQVGDGGLAQLKECKELRVVDLSGTKVTDEGLADLKNFEGLTNLDLGFTQVSDAGLPVIAGLHKLTDLNLTKSKVTAQGAKELANAIPSCAITWNDGVIEPNDGSDRRAAEYVLSIGGVVEIDRVGEIKFLARLPKRASRLTRADLSNNPEVTDAGLSAFKDCQHLNVLDLTGTPVTDAGLAHLSGLSELKNLPLSKTKVTSNGVERLAKALPRCKIVWDGGIIGQSVER
jgi:serine/threonine protein kinase/Leucine-rich repeat (LRR) protein